MLFTFADKMLKDKTFTLSVSFIIHIKSLLEEAIKNI